MLNVPAHLLQEERVQMALYVLVESSKVTRERKLVKEVQD